MTKRHAARIALGYGPISPEDAVSLVASSENGAVVTFLGVVRSFGAEGISGVTRLEYEAYEPMALAKMEEIARDLEKMMPVQVAIHHRLGSVATGEVAVVIAVGSSHRKEAFLACEQAIERLKAEVPIWKKEHTSDGAEWV